MRLECWDSFFLWPLIYYKSSGGSTTIHLLFSLIIWYRSAVETSVKIGLVVLWVTVSSTKSFFHILGVIWYSNKNGRVYAHLFPFVFYNEGSMNTWLVIFPVLWVKKGPSKTTVYFMGVIYITVSDSGTTFFLVPFIYIAKMDTGFRFFLVPFIWVSGYNGGYKFIIAPIFFLIQTSTIYRCILFPILWYSKSATVKTIWFIPVWYRRKDQLTTVFVIPAVYYQRSSMYKFVWTLPFWIVTYHDGSYLYSIAYLIYYLKGATTSKFILFPIVWFSKYAESGDWRLVFFPFLWLRRAPTHSHTVVFPIVWVYTGGSSNTIIVLPIFYKFSKITMVLPIYFSLKNSNTDYYKIVALFYYRRFGNCVSWCFFPIIWAHKNSDTQYSRLYVLPVYYYIKSPELKVIHFWPIFGKTTNPMHTSYYVLWPIAVFTFSAEGTTARVIPLFNYKRLGGNSFFISPLVYRLKTDTEHVLFVLPVYLFKKKPDYELRVIVPALYISRLSNGNLFKYAFLLYLKLVSADEHKTFVYFFPLYGKETRGHTSVRHYLLWPLFSRRIDKEAEVFVLDVLFPLFHYETTPTVNAVRFLLYWHRKTPSRDFRIILPLYFSFTQKSAPERSLHRDASAQMSRNESLDSSSGNILNVNSYDSDIMSGADDELPISETGAGAVTLGTLNKKETKRREEDVVSKIIFFFPFFIRRETALTGVIYGSPLLILPPLFIKTWDKKTGDFTTRLWPLYSHEKKGTTDMKTILIVLMRYFTDVEMDIVRFNLLLFFYRRSKDFTSYFLFPLFYRSKGAEYENFMILILYFFSKQKGEDPITRTALLWLHPQYCTLMARVKAATYTTTFFWPIFWRQNGHDTGRVANSFLWLHPTLALAKYRHQGEQIKFFIFPLVHIRHDGIRRTFSLLWFAFPQFAMFRVVKENGETIIRYWWPIYYHSAIGSDTLTCVLWIHPYVAMCKSINHSTEGRTFFIFPLVYVRRAPTLTLVALVWFFHPYAAMFMRAQHTDSQTTNTWLFPVFWMKRAPGHAETAFVFLFHPRASVVYRLRKDAQTLTHVLILYWHRVTEHINDYGLIWLFYFPATLIYWHKNSQNGHAKFYFWPIVYVQQKESRSYCLLYFYPPKFAFISSSGTGNVTIWLIYCARTIGNNTVYSILYLFHPAACFIKVTRGPEVFGAWMLIVFYYFRDRGETNFSLVWIHPTKGYAFVSWNTSASGDMVGHVFLLFWKEIEDGNLSFGFLWFFFYKLSLFAYYSTPEYTKHYFLLLYSYNSNSEVSTLALLLWLIYITSSPDLFQFRIIYRFFRIATGRKRVVELQPLFHYKAKNGEMQFIMLGCFGFGHKNSRGNYCRVTCCSCDV